MQYFDSIHARYYLIWFSWLGNQRDAKRNNEHNHSEYDGEVQIVYFSQYRGSIVFVSTTTMYRGVAKV